MGFSITGTTIALLILLPSIFFFSVFSLKNIPKYQPKSPIALVVLRGWARHPA
jgi:hypothetical protein